MNNGLKVFLYIIVSIFLSANAIAQVNQGDLLPLLSSSDHRNFEKIELNYTKGRALEDEAIKIKDSGSTDKETAKNQKKYTIKRLEASQFYQKANSLYFDLLKDNISNYKKINKYIQIDIFTRNKEDQASELAREARSIRYVAEDLTYPDEKLSKIIEAEETEKEAISIYIKVLYAYLNQPITYDVPKSKNNGTALVNENTDTLNLKVNEKTAKEDEIEHTILPQANQDSLPRQQISEKKDSVITSHAIIPEASQTETKPLNVIPEKKDTLNNSGSIYDMVDVKENQLDRFNKFLEDSFPNTYENYVINFRDLDYSDIESLKQAWHLYLYSEIPSGKPMDIWASNDSIQLVAEKNSKLNNTTESVISQNAKKVASKTKPNDNFKAEKSTEVKNGITDNEIKVSETKKLELANPKVDSENDISKFSEENKLDHTNTQIDKTSNSSIEVAKGFLYRVQVSACRIPLDANSLKDIYDGELQVLELNEDKWYKYAVGEFNTYNQARILKEQLGVPGAFVIAYLNGKRINIINTTSQISGIHLSDNSEIIYKVQIVAAKAPLDKNYILNIYNGNKDVEENFEDGWYKYSIVIGSSLLNVKKFIDSENIPGAFITSYLDNKRIELKEAIRISKSNK